MRCASVYSKYMLHIQRLYRAVSLLHGGGDNARLTDCPANDIGIHNCYHSQDAGVRCGMCIICLDQNTQSMQALSKCTDIDECGRSDACHVNADCRNTLGSYTCTCRSGYHGNGVICEGIYYFRKLQLPVHTLLL